ncbi:MAG: hypothetical protein DI539_22400 [Flavobacterium psychrophilum]|jgi:hypothetical protein|nr:MAG: hypothetical protein DI539_22400 [Flavobacterium psychrophilum]
MCLPENPHEVDKIRCEVAGSQRSKAAVAVAVTVRVTVRAVVEIIAAVVKFRDIKRVAKADQSYENNECECQLNI